MLGTGRKTIPRHFINLTHALVIGNYEKTIGWVDQEGNRLKFNHKVFSIFGKSKLINNVLTKNKVDTDRS